MTVQRRTRRRQVADQLSKKLRSLHERQAELEKKRTGSRRR
jgi:hypothetical protein